MSRFIEERLGRINEYVPGEQPQDKKYIKLNTNESPYPPPANVTEAVGKKEIEDLRLYSDPECRLLKEKLAEIYGVKPGNMFISNGSDEVLNFAFMCYGHKGASFADITYGFYIVFAELYGIDADIIPLKDDLTIDPADYFNKGRLVVIANPNAPTGMLMSLADVKAILENNTDDVVIVDEAYVDFGGESALSLLAEHDNLLVVRTFSKSRSMAGARLGFGIADEAIIRDLEKIRYSTNPYNINRITQITGLRALENDGYFMDNCRRIIDTREYVTEELRKMGFFVTDSRTNFVFARSDDIGGAELYEALKERGILIRHFSIPRIRDFNRITIGSREEMEIFLENVREILAKKE
ncbi:MAG: histidinol-phosphate transaminase [Lachnospiraceae bacterium]|nr:histidinol-phosphate transaminase [Lachnospiraceae bacterium]